MKPLYKYLPIEFAKGLAEKGTVKLGTLSDYQNEDHYGKDIGDQGEGSLTEWSRINDRKNVTQSDLNRVEKRGIKIADGITGVEIKDCLFAVSHQSKDLYVFSTSRVFNAQLMRSISRDYQKTYDACVRIHNPNKFIGAVSDAFKEMGKFEGSSLCRYMSREKHHGKPAPHPAFIKELRHQYQEEVRAIWSPLGAETIQTAILEIPELTKYCDLYYVDSGSSTDDGVPQVSQKSFENDVVKVDSCAYYKCIFKNTEIVFCAEDTTLLDTCEFHNCHWTFSGAADRTLSFMKSVYHGMGSHGKKMLDDTFENMKKL